MILHPGLTITEFNQAFGRSLRERRRASGLSISQLAERSGAHTSSVWRMEHGKGGCQAGTAWVIAAVFETTVDEMVREGLGLDGSIPSRGHLS